MDMFDDPVDVLALASILLLMLLKTHNDLSLSSSAIPDEDNNSEGGPNLHMWDSTSVQMDAVSRATLNQFRLFSTLASFDEDLGFWVKPRSTTWFSRFLMHEYNDARWVQMFRLTKCSIFTLSQLLSRSVKRKDTKYRLAVPVTVQIACSLFKLSHGASLLICSELFAVGRSTVSIMLRQVVNAINTSLRGEIAWPSGDAVHNIAADFQNICGLPGVLGAIDGTHIAIGKPRMGAPDYYYFKSGGYTINCQAVVDNSRRFLDLYVGMPESTNDSRMLRRSTLFHRGQRSTLWEETEFVGGYSPFLLGNAGYPLLPWLMVPHRRVRDLSLADQLFNRRLSKGRVVVENAFGLLKQIFHELQQRTDMHVAFIPDVVTCCAILHNVLLKQSHEEVERLLQILRGEGHRTMPDDPTPAEEAAEVVEDNHDNAGPYPNVVEGQQKRQDLDVFLSLQRVAPI